MRLRRWVSRAGLRIHDHLPEHLWQHLVELASHAGDVPTIGLPSFDRVLVLAPHPDDETIGCGGTIARLVDRGANVQVVLATDGEATIGSPYPRAETAVRRRREAIEACALLGVAQPPRCLGLPDGDVQSHSDALTRSIQQSVEELRPELVLTPWLLDRHPDHLAVTRSLARAVVPGGTQVWGYEAHVPLLATRAVVIDGVVDRKFAALRVHRTAALAMDLDATLALNRWRSLLTAAGRGHAEAFHALDWDTFVAFALGTAHSV